MEAAASEVATATKTATMEAATAEVASATTKVTATAAKSTTTTTTTATVPSRRRGLTEGKQTEANHAKYCFCFHILRSR